MRLSRASTWRWPRSSIEQMRKKTSVMGTSTPKGMPVVVTPSARKGWLRILAIGRRGCSKATPFSNAVECISSRAADGVGHRLGSHSQPVAAASSTIESITEFRVRAGRGMAIASKGSMSAMETSSSASAWGRSCKTSFDFEQFALVGQSDAAFQPMMDIGLGEPPLAADLAARQLAAIGQLCHLLRGQVEVSGQGVNVEVVGGHDIMFADRPTFFKTEGDKFRLDRAAEIRTIRAG